MAGDPLAAPLLAGLGLTQFSMNAAAISAVKARLRQISLAEANAFANQALQMASAQEVRRLLNLIDQKSGADCL
jgi:phosphoenolpyruvate-protein kinase (PTS system EI component)